jgi:Family of unknown function (DUF6364)
VEDTNTRQNITLSLDKATLHKAKVLAARRDTSISRLLSQQIQALVEEDEIYERSRREAARLLEKGFRLGGGGMTSRDQLHER